MPGRLVLGFSGGLDSSLLLAALVRAGFAARLDAVHVAHGLQPAAQAWGEHCAAIAAAQGVRFSVAHLSLSPGANLEARARDARRAALVDATPADGALLLAHHADDQAETVLLRLLRGAGPAGLAAMAPRSIFENRLLLRPLLDTPRATLAALAREWGLVWVEDPTNTDVTPDRNFLRHQVLPALTGRWPGLVATLGRDARLQAEAAALQADIAATDCDALLRADGSLSLRGLAALSRVRQRNLLYGWLRATGRRAPAEKVLQRVLDELAGAGQDRLPEVAWPEGVFCRYRDGLYLLGPDARMPLTETIELPLADGISRRLGPGTVTVARGQADDVAAVWLPLALQRVWLGPAPQGARILRGGLHRDLRELWRVAGVPPWRRRQLPVVLGEGPGDDRPVLLAAAGIGTADPVRPAPGAPAWRLDWTLS